MDLDPVDLGDLLADAGFTREDPVDEHGEFCVRGGIVDWFPAGADNPIRVEFVGETVESIRRYDPSTQRSIETVDQASVVPLTEKRRGSATFFDYLPDDRDLDVHHPRRRRSHRAGDEARRADSSELRRSERRESECTGTRGIAGCVGRHCGAIDAVRRSWSSWRSTRATTAEGGHAIGTRSVRATASPRDVPRHSVPAGR